MNLSHDDLHDTPSRDNSINEFQVGSHLPRGLHPLTSDELKAVAGGPEGDVSNGIIPQ